MQHPMTHRMALPASVVLPRRVASAGALLCLVLGLTLAQSQRGESSPAVPAARGGVAARGGLSSLPLSAQGPVSAALGAEGSSYRVSAGPGGVLATVNRPQHLSARFARSGVELRSGRVRLGLSLVAFGYGTSLHAVDAVAPRVSSNEVLYEHTELSEWYSNGPLGLEQGFTVARAPSSGVDGPLAISLAISGDTHVSLGAKGEGLSFRGPDGPALHYGSLLATDARGRTLHSWLQLWGGRVLLRVATAGARYPVRIDPLIQQEPEQKLTASDESGEGLFGYSVAISADGNTALVGGPTDNGGFGAAWVFVRSGSTWTQQGPKLVGEPDAEGSGEGCGEEPVDEGDACGFGRSLALSADGNTALIGSARDSRFEPPRNEGEEGHWVANVGAAWVFTRTGTQWTQRGTKLAAAEERGEGRFGKSVALSADGQTALIGASSDDAGGGSAWVFTRSDANWARQGGKLTGGEEEGEGHFGLSVALSADGETALIGGAADAGHDGAAWIFTRSQETGEWIQQGAKLTGAGESREGRFGWSVALSADGATALVGARDDDEQDGAAWVFTRSGSSWNEQGPKLTGPEETGEQFGYSVALSADGNTALVGAPRAGGSRGAAWLLERSGSTWSRTASLASSAEKGKSWFGYSVALSPEATAALVGGPLESLGKEDRPGAVWAFSADPLPMVTGVLPKQGPETGGTEVTIKGTNFSEATAVRFGEEEAASFEVQSATEIMAVTPRGTGVVDVTVTNPNGTSATAEADRFTFLPPKQSSTPAPEAPVNVTSEPEPVNVTAMTTSTGSATPAGGVLAFGPGKSVVCGVSLLKRGIAVETRSRAVLELKATGPGTCRGTLKLIARIRVSRRRFKNKTIAAGSFSIAGGKVRTVTLRLNAVGRALLRARRGRITAKLTILRLSPLPRAARTAAVRLALQKTHKPARAKK